MKANVNFLTRTAGFVIAFVIVWVILRSPSQNNATHQKPEYDPNRLNPDTNYPGIATDLFNAFDGWDFLSVKVEAMQTALQLNEDEFKFVYTIYNKIYAKAPETMKTHAQGEFMWGDVIDQFIHRCNILQLP